MASVFLMTRPLRDHFVRRLSVCPSVRLSHFCFDDYFFTLRDRALIFGKCVPYDKTVPMVHCTINFDHVTLTVTLYPYFENLNSGHNFFTIGDRAFIFSMCVPYAKTFLMVP